MLDRRVVWWSMLGQGRRHRQRDRSASSLKANACDSTWKEARTTLIFRGLTVQADNAIEDDGRTHAHMFVHTHPP